MRQQLYFWVFTPLSNISNFFKSSFSASNNLILACNFSYFSSMDKLHSLVLPLLNFLVSCSCAIPFFRKAARHLLPDDRIRLSPIISISKPYSSNICLGNFPRSFSLINILLNSSEYVIPLILTFLTYLFLDKISI